ncbi:Protein CBG11614 [Caenorhabditis briggsae]|uniref:Protein CBG11614 n=1 Tax=Caenorhabditis briggsae TaxID=6238 RepID=A8XDM4_CAEBR|nr:Protein CBG11614 [Caenorhabditis briggsae]CAP30744.2 Protein CBG11614 [Caenorhabditis briggsae]
MGSGNGGQSGDRNSRNKRASESKGFGGQNNQGSRTKFGEFQGSISNEQTESDPIRRKNKMASEDSGRPQKAHNVDLIQITRWAETRTPEAKDSSSNSGFGQNGFSGR